MTETGNPGKEVSIEMTGAESLEKEITIEIEKRVSADKGKDINKGTDEGIKDEARKDMEEKDKVGIEDLYQFRFISGVTLSPDGGHAVYMVNRADEEGNCYKGGIWLLDLKTRGNRLLAERGDVRDPLWLDGQTVAFAAKRGDPDEHLEDSCAGANEKASEDRTVYYKIRIDGGEAVRMMEIPAKVKKLTRVADGLWLVSAVADDFKEDAGGGSCGGKAVEDGIRCNEGAKEGHSGRETGEDGIRGKEAGKDGLRGKEGGEDGLRGGKDVEDRLYSAVRGKDYDIYEELPFWFNGRGVCSRRRSALYLFAQSEGTLKRITPELLDVVSYDVSADGELIAFAGPCFKDIKPFEHGIYLYSVTDGSVRQIADSRYGAAGNVSFIGNEALFFTGTPAGGMGMNPRHYRMDLSTGAVSGYPFPDAIVGCSVCSDSKYGSNRELKYCPGNGRIYMLQTTWGDSRLAVTDGSAFSTLTKEKGAVLGFDVAAADGDASPTVIISAMRGQGLAELYLLDAESGSEVKLTSFNDRYTEGHALAQPEYFRYRSANGQEMDGYVMKPAGYEEGKKYPAVFEIHGGPKTASGSVFFHEFQCLSSAGYFVFYGNPRGSDGRGEKFADIAEAFGKDDFDDLMELFDEVLKRYSDIDERRVGISGGSYGGFMCNWMVGHTDRFAAACAQRSISNYITKCLDTDIGYHVNHTQMGAYPWEDFGKVWSMSPISAAPETKTPLLLLQSDEDYRCYMSDAIQMFSAVRRAGTDARLVLFHGENHELSRSGKPQNRVTRLKEMMAWFGKYLKPEA